MILLQNLFLIPMVTILAESICSKNFCNVPSAWIPQARGVCHGVKDNDFGSFKIKKDCALVALRLEHVSGILTDRKDQQGSFSRWGTKKGATGGDNELNTVILKGNKLLLPEKINNGGFYSLKEFEVNDDVLIFKKRCNLTAGEELQVAFGKDYKDKKNNDEDSNAGYLTALRDQTTTRSRWGTEKITNIGNELSTVILKGNKLFLPEKISEKGCYYSLEGFGVQDDVLIFNKRVNLTVGEEFQIAFGRDFKDKAENLSEGYHCLNIDISCLV